MMGILNFSHFVVSWWGKLSERDRLEDLVVDGRVSIKMDVKEIVWEVAEWSLLSQARYNWRAYINAVMNRRMLLWRYWLCCVKR